MGEGLGMVSLIMQTVCLTQQVSDLHSKRPFTRGRPSGCEGQCDVIRRHIVTILRLLGRVSTKTLSTYRVFRPRSAPGAP